MSTLPSNRAALPDLSPGASFGPFRIARALGRGGFAPVFLAEEIHEGKKLRDVALKTFSPPQGVRPSSAEASEWRDRILDEARALCRVEHPSVVRFYAVHRDDASGALGLAMEYVPGESLGARLRSAGTLEEREVIDIGAHVAWALAAVHAAGLVHRDVKPDNIVAGAAGYKLIDFGVVAERPKTPDAGAAEGEVRVSHIGTPGYIAPECLQRGAPPSPASDLYALGVTLYRLLTGDMPGKGGALGETVEFNPDEGAGNALDEVTAPAARGGRSPSALRPELQALLTKLLDHEPFARPQHADWVARELERMRGDASRTSLLPAAPTEAAGDVIATARAPRRSPAPDAQTPWELVQHPPLLGREEALSIIEQAAIAAQGGQLQMVMISGPLGVGRTRLLGAAIDRADLDPGRVLRGQCCPERRSLLRPLERAMEALSPEDAVRLGAVEEAIQEATSPESPNRARAADNELENVEEALLWASSEEPLLLAIDDIQWGDAYTLELLGLLCERASAGWACRLLVMVTVRHEPSPSAALRQLLGRARMNVRSAVRHISLQPLPPPDAASLAQAVGPLAPELERAVTRGSGGVPFFLVHALLAWRAMGALVFRDGAWHAADEGLIAEGAPGVADLVEARLAACFGPTGPTARAALRALAAVALYGGGLSVDVLYLVAGEDEHVESALEALVAIGLLTVAGDRQEHSFAQEMVRQAVLNLVRTRPWFFRLHRALLDTIASRPGADAEAAFLATGYDKLGVPDQARRWLKRAMETATAAGLFTEVAELGDKLAALAADAEERVATQLAVVRALVLGRRLEDAKARLKSVEAFELAGGAVSPASSLRRRIYRLDVARGLHEAHGGDATLAADADAHGDPTLRCEARIALAGVAPSPRSIELAGEAIELAAAAGPALELTARVLRVELCYASTPRNLALAASDLERALALARAASSAWQEMHIEGDLAVIEAELGRTGAAIERLRRLVEQAEARGLRGERRRFSQNLAAFLLREGRAREAADVAAETARLAMKAGDPVLGANAWSLRADALRRLGELGEALASIDEAEAIQRRQGDRMRSLTLLRRAEILEALDRGGEAVDDALEARRLAEEHGEKGIEVTAALWEALYRARRGEIPAAELARALAGATAPDLARRALTRSLIAQAEAWLEANAG